jgi:hypothetical protein
MSYFQQNTDINQDNTFQNGRISTEFSPNKYNTFTLAGNLVGGSYNTFTNQSYAYKDAQNKVLSSGTRTTVLPIITPILVLNSTGKKLCSERKRVKFDDFFYEKYYF